MSDRRKPLMHKGFPCRHRVLVEAGFWPVAPGWRVADTLARGLGYLLPGHGVQNARWPQWRSRRRRRPRWSNCLFKRRTTRPSPVWIGQNPDTEPFSASASCQDAMAIPRSRNAGAESELHNRHPRQPRSGERPRNGHPSRVCAQTPQIPHARATSCSRYTSRPWRWKYPGAWNSRDDRLAHFRRVRPC